MLSKKRYLINWTEPTPNAGKSIPNDTNNFYGAKLTIVGWPLNDGYGY
jgi:hypothetical protein